MPDCTKYELQHNVAWSHSGVVDKKNKIKKNQYSSTAGESWDLITRWSNIQIVNRSQIRPLALHGSEWGEDISSYYWFKSMKREREAAFCFAAQDGLDENPVLISNTLLPRSMPARSETGLADPSWNKDIILILCSRRTACSNTRRLLPWQLQNCDGGTFIIVFYCCCWENDSRVLSVTHAQALGNGPQWQAVRNDSIILYILHLFTGAFHFIHPRHRFSNICK